LIFEFRVANASFGTVAPSILELRKSEMGKNNLPKKEAPNPAKTPPWESQNCLWFSETVSWNGSAPMSFKSDTLMFPINSPFLFVTAIALTAACAGRWVRY
jgi:hypothetical protein